MSENHQETAVLAALPLSVPHPGRARTITAGEIRLLSAVSECADDDLTVADVIHSAGAAVDAHLVLPLVVSLTSSSTLLRELEREHGLVTVAALSHRCALGAPINADDTITTESEIVAARASSSRPGHYVMTVRDVGVNQHGMEVAQIDRVLLLRHDAAMRETKIAEG